MRHWWASGASISIKRFVYSQIEPNILFQKIKNDNYEISVDLEVEVLEVYSVYLDTSIFYLLDVVVLFATKKVLLLL